MWKSFFKIGRCLIVIVLGLSVVLLFMSCSLENLKLPENAAYLLIYSDMLDNKGGYFCIDAEGKSSVRPKRLNMQDLSKFDVNEEKIVLSGARRNNSLIFEKGSCEFNKNFLFLNEHGRTGVTTLKINGDELLGILNGGFTETTYITHLVLQSVSGKVLKEIPLEIYAEDSIYNGSKAVIFGFYEDLKAVNTENEECAQIISCNLKNDDKPEYHKYADYSSFVQAAAYGSGYLCLTADKQFNLNTLVVINSETYELEYEMTVGSEKNLNSLFVFNEHAYTVDNEGIYEIDFEKHEFIKKLSFKDYDCIKSGGFVDFAYCLNDYEYVFLRNNLRDTEKALVNDRYEYGCLLKLNLRDFQVSKTVISGKKSMPMDTIFLIPASFFASYQ